jgi:UDP-N-acetylglucosamine:LPS N-acetylglucosamine transferase
MSDARPRILLLYTKTGGGHLSAARAIKAAIDTRYPDTYDVVLYDVADSAHSPRVAMLYGTYNLMLKASPGQATAGWMLLNALQGEKGFMPWMPRAVQAVEDELRQARPALMVSVHGIVNHVMLHARAACGWTERVPYAIVCTDLTDRFLNGWANPNADLLITFTEAARRQMVDYGVPEEKVRVINGFTVHPEFAQPGATRAACRTALGLHPELFTVLVSLGGMAIPGKTKQIVRALGASGLPLQLIVVCGMNRSLEQQVHKLLRRYPVRAQVHGFTQRIAEMMTAADVMISKPGPGSIMEAVVKELPLLLDAVTKPMPQEQGNLAFAEAQGIALPITRYVDLPNMINLLMTDANAYASMQSAMRRMKNADAIFDVADALLGLLPVKTDNTKTPSAAS